MPLIIGLGSAAFALSYLLVDFFRRWAEKRRILDHPNDRSAHTVPTVRGAGAAEVCVVLPLVWLAWQMGGTGDAVPGLLAYTAGALLIAGVSWLDDLRTLPNGIKFAAHSAGAVALLATAGWWTQLALPFDGLIDVPLVGMVVTFVWIVGLTNAYNFMDGADGLAGSQAVVGGLAWAVFAWKCGEPVLAALATIVAAASLGFLGHNWPPARVFMGDVGSTFLGYTFAAIPVLLSSRPRSDGGAGIPWVAVLIFWPFIFDTAFTLARRLRKRQRVFEAHRSHLYQRLAIAGVSSGSLTLTYALLALLGGVLAEAWSEEGIRTAVPGSLVLPLLCVGLWVTTVQHERSSRGEFAFSPGSFLRYRKPVIVLSQAVLLAFTYYLSFLLRLDFSIGEPYRSTFFRTLPIFLAVKLAVFAYFRLYSGWWRYVGMSDLLDIIKAAAVSAPVAYGLVHVLYGFADYPRSVFIIDPILTVLVIGGSRFAVRANAENARIYMNRATAIIVGAGQTGSHIVRELKGNTKLDYFPIGFVDDDRSKVGVQIQGIKVLGTTQDLPRLIAEHEVSYLLLAIPSAKGRQVQRIVDICRECKVDFKIVPAFGDVISGGIGPGQVRSVRVEDLLTREPVRLELRKIRERLQGKTVMVTGAAGSIGSELVRQVAAFQPARLVLFDRSETDLFKIDLELAERFPSVPRVAAIGDIRDVPRLREIHDTHRPQSVFHAAAYKHVPIMESNVSEAVANNVLGTHNAATLAREYGVDDFVMISTDKAVNPSSVMGATKRFAELVILAQQNHSTRFVSVRFGNVLGSRGSVLPLFEEQIARRKPITVTHPDARRYFMTVPEAVQLVLQASTMGQGGEIFVLDMGEPIRIVDMARDLIRLSGLEPGKDIPIQFTGLRPGEKLFEELRLDAEGLKPTTHEKIRVLDGGRIDPLEVRAWMDEVARLLAARDERGLLACISRIVPEYSPNPPIRPGSA